MAMAATEIDTNGVVAGPEFKSSPEVSMDGSQEDHGDVAGLEFKSSPDISMDGSQEDHGDIAGLEFKSSPDVSMDGSQEDHSQALNSFDNETPALTMETSTWASPTANISDVNTGESDNDFEELVEIDEDSVPNVIQEICPVDGPCVQCEIEQPCSFRFTDNGETLYVCNEPCIKAYQAEYPGKYTVTRKKYLIEEISPITLLCAECEEMKTCYFYHNFHYCSLNCLEIMMSDEKDKYAFTRNSVTKCINQIRPIEGQCFICETVKPCEFSLVRYGEPCLLCERTCIKILCGRERGRYYIKKLRVSKLAIDKNLDEGYKIQEKTAARVHREQSFRRRCSQCTLILMMDENVLAWEAMDFCDEICLERFQTGIGSICTKCNHFVQNTSLGKYCVRFGYDIRQFCNSSCLEEFKKGLKICCYCQRDMSSMQNFLAPVGDKGQFKDFCTQSCVEKFVKMSKNPVPQPVWAKCAVCSLEKATTIEMELTKTASQRICSDTCFAAYTFINNILPDQCKWCKKYFERKSTKSFTTYDDSNPNCFCSQSCMTIHINYTKIIVSCDRCKSLKYSFDMIRRVENGQAVMMCSLYCLSLHKDSANALTSSKSPEQIITLTETRKQPETTQSSKQEEHQINKSVKKHRLVIPDSPPSGRKKGARSSGIVKSESEVSESAPSRPASPMQHPSPPPTHRRRRRTDLINYGSEEDSDKSDDEEVVAFSGIPRVLQSIMETPLDEDFAGDPAPADVPPTATDKPWSCSEFEWKEFPDSSIPPESRRETFSESNVGPTTPRDDPYDIFVDIWDRQIMEHIVSETNKYAQQLAAQVLENHTLQPSSRISRWYDTTTDELYVYFGIVLAMGIVVKSRLEEYWASTPDILYTPGFSAHMPVDRFLLISKCLHFNDNDDMFALDLDYSEAKLYKIQPILTHLNKKFQELYTPAQNIAVDESLLKWKGWLEMSLTNKAAKRGIKSYELCEPQTGYLWRFEVHTPQKTPPQQIEDPLEASTPSIVLRLTKGLENKGYTVWMDNFYNSPCLARRLKTLGFDCAGTLRTDRKFVPQTLDRLTKQDMRRGQIAGLTSGDVDVMVWRDHYRVSMISTYHGNAQRTVRGSTKPILILDYNIMMGGVDKKDQLLAIYPIERKRTRVWYKNFFRRLLNVSVLNSYVIYRHNSSITHRNFRIKLIKSLLSLHSLPPTPYLPPVPSRIVDVSHRLSEYPMGTHQRKRQQCTVCKKQVHTFCVGCGKTSCIEPCFLQIHS